MKEINNENDLTIFLRKNDNITILFYASWCPFCGMFLPLFEKYALTRDDEQFIRVRIDEEDSLFWNKYCIEEVPTVISFKGERVVKRLDAVSGEGLNEKHLKSFLKR